MIGNSDTALVRRFFEAAAEMGVSQAEAGRRAEIPQSTVSRWAKLLAAGEPIPLHPKNRIAIRAFLARQEARDSERVVMLARQLAADILRDISDALRASAGEAPEELMPPTLRRLLGGEAATGSDADAERQAARLERMAAQQEEMRERRRQERRTGER